MDLKQKLNNYNEFVLGMLWHYKISLSVLIIITVLMLINLSWFEELQQYYLLVADYGKEVVLSLDDIEKKKDEFDYILDVRSNEEYTLGHVPNSINIDHKLLLEEHPSIELSKKGITKSSKVLVYCRSGRRAGKVMRSLLEDGYKKENLFMTKYSYDKLTPIFKKDE